MITREPIEQGRLPHTAPADQRDHQEVVLMGLALTQFREPLSKQRHFPGKDGPRPVVGGDALKPQQNVR